MTEDPSPAGVRKRFILIWAPRIGTEAAASYYGAIRDAFIASGLGPLWLALILAGVFSAIPALWIAGVVVAGAQTVVFILGWLQLIRFKREASQSLGVTIGWRDIPAKQDEYVQWCETKDIEPFGRE